MSMYLLETKFERFTIREEVEASDPMSALVYSQLAFKPFEGAVRDYKDAVLIVTNQNNTKETLTLTFNGGK